MVMTIPAGELRSAHSPRLLDALRAAWHGYLERRAHRLALRRAGRLGPRLLADMGSIPTLRDAWTAGTTVPDGLGAADAATAVRLGRCRLARGAQWSLVSSSSSDFLASP